MNYYIKAKEWEQILLILCDQKGIHTQNRQKLRLFVEAVWYVARSGCQWRLLPSYYGSYRAVHRRFKSWSDRGIWSLLFERIQEPDLEEVMIDATIVRSHACSAGYGKNTQNMQALGRSKGDLQPKSMPW